MAFAAATWIVNPLCATLAVLQLAVQTGKLPEHESPGSTGLVLAHENVTLALGKVPAVVMLKPRELAVPVTATVTGAGVVLYVMFTMCNATFWECVRPLRSVPTPWILKLKFATVGWLIVGVKLTGVPGCGLFGLKVQVFGGFVPTATQLSATLLLYGTALMPAAVPGGTVVGWPVNVPRLANGVLVAA